MDEKINMTEVVAEVKNANEDELKEVITKHFEEVRTQGMKVGAVYISAAIYGILKKHLHKDAKVTLRDYKRAVDEIIKIISVQLKTEQDESNQEAAE